MQDLKISLITVVYNAQNTIERCIKSVVGQQFLNLEYIVIDGGSTDGTINIIKKYRDNVTVFISEPDKGIYDAMNKGIAQATGDVIGTLNADDYLFDNEVLNNIGSIFTEHNIDILYGDLDYVDIEGKIKRKWRSGKYKEDMFNWGWMPPHPTFYCKRELFEKFGSYSLNYGSAADYELMSRFIHLHKIKPYYLDIVMVVMIVGGISNKSIVNRVRALRFDLKAMRNNNIMIPQMAVLLKPMRKMVQFFKNK